MSCIDLVTNIVLIVQDFTEKQLLYLTKKREENALIIYKDGKYERYGAACS